MTRTERWLAGSKLGDKTLFWNDMDNVDERSTIHLLAPNNPKRGERGKRFALYREGMTIKEYITAIGDEKLARMDLAWDQNHRFISILSPEKKIWSVFEAKAKLSEILRLARAGEPQTIGSEEPCVVISAEQFEQLPQRQHLGKFLIETAPRGVELELPPRGGDRPDPFADL